MIVVFSCVFKKCHLPDSDNNDAFEALVKNLLEVRNKNDGMEIFSL